MKEISSQNHRSPWIVGFTSRQKWLLQVAKIQEMSSRELRFHDSAEFLLSGLQNSENELTQIFCPLELWNAMWKRDLCRVVKPTVQGVLATCEHIFYILAAWIWEYCRVVKPTFQGDVGSWALISCILAVWKRGFYIEMKPKVQRDQCSCELIYYLLVIWKRDFCRFLKPSVRGYFHICERIPTI